MPRNAPTRMSSVSMGTTSGEGRLGVGPGLDIRPDRLVAVRSDDNPLAAEVKAVHFAVGVMTLEGCRVGLVLEIPRRDPPVCSVEVSCGEDRSSAGVEPGEAGVPVGDVPDDFCIVVLVRDLRGVGLTGLFHTGVCYTSGHVGYTSEGVRYDDCLDDRVERRRIRNRFCQVAEGGLGGCSILEVCHSFSLLSSLSFSTCLGGPFDTYLCAEGGITGMRGVAIRGYGVAGSGIGGYWRVKRGIGASNTCLIVKYCVLLIRKLIMFYNSCSVALSGLFGSGTQLLHRGTWGDEDRCYNT